MAWRLWIRRLARSAIFPTPRPTPSIAFSTQVCDTGLDLNAGTGEDNRCTRAAVEVTILSPIVTLTLPGLTAGPAGEFTAPDGSGKVNVSPFDLPYYYGTVVTLTATANQGWSFGEWGGACAEQSNPCVLTLLADTIVTATFPSLPHVQFDRAAYGVGEAAGPAVLTVTLDSVNLTAAVQVTVRSADGSATAPADYMAISQVVTIPAGIQQVTVTVPIVADAVDEPNETVIFTLSNPVGAILGATVTATLTITDDDAAGVMVHPTSGLTTTEASGTATFTVVLTSATDQLRSP